MKEHKDEQVCSDHTDKSSRKSESVHEETVRRKRDEDPVPPPGSEPEHRERGELYRQLFQNMTEGFALGEPILDKDGLSHDFRFIEINSAFERQTGLTRNVLGRPVTQVLPRVEDYWIETYCNVALSGMPVRFENYNKDLDKYFSVYCYSPVQGRFAILFSDVTARKRAEEALRESEQKFRSLFESSPDAVFLTTPNGSVQAANPAACDLFGYSEQELCGLGRSGILDTEDPGYLAGLEERQRTGWIKGIELTAIRKHAEKFPVELDSVILRGKPERSFVIMRDITERKHMEEQLRRSRDDLELRVKERTLELVQLNEKLNEQKEVLRKVIDNIPVMIAFYNPTGDVPMLNQHAMDVIGISPEQLGKIDIMERCYPDPDYRQEVLDYMLEAAPGWKDIHMVVKDGKTIESSWANVLLSDGSFIGIGIDVTQRKRAEEALRSYAKRLEVLNRELQEFAFAASHDLSEPLRKIQTFGNLVQSRGANRLDDQMKDYIARITGAAGRMQELLDALLRYSRIDTRGEKFTPVDLNQIVKDAASDLEIAVRDIGAKVEISPLPTVTGDSKQLRQLFQNLLANALKYSRKEVDTTIKIYGWKKDGKVHILVEDNGIGFDEQYREKIFEPFKRLHGRNEYPGIGMGLAICRKIVERHGWIITATSTPGKGSRFSIEIPRRSERSRLSSHNSKARPA